MKEKPLVPVVVLGEFRYQAMFTQANPNTESESRRYHVETSFAAITRARAFLLVYGATQTSSPTLDSILLFASRFSSEMVVLLVECVRSKSEESLDRAENTLRMNLTEQGFYGDNATILRVKSAPTQTDLEQALQAFDERDLLDNSPRQTKELPESHPSRDLALLLLRLQQMLRTATILTPTTSTTEELLQHPISTQIGGSPYIEINEAWPTCQVCRSQSRLAFLWQIDARVHLIPEEEQLGLFVFYFCEQLQHQAGEDRFVIKHYLSPTKERRQIARRESSNRSFRDYSSLLAPMSVLASFKDELPHSRQIQEQYTALWQILSQNLPKQPNLSEAMLYRQLVVQFDALQVQPSENTELFKVGGYCELPPQARYSNCSSCQKELLVLASVHLSRHYGFLIAKRGVRFLVCPCNPNKISIFYANPP
jgi:hypothetical protein